MPKPKWTEVDKGYYFVTEAVQLPNGCLVRMIQNFSSATTAPGPIAAAFIGDLTIAELKEAFKDQD